MSTVATSHTVHRHAAAPLRVPKRPPRNDVTHAIQKFLPYAVVFLLSLMVYSSFKSTPVSYPPYSPPNVLPEDVRKTSIDVGSVFNERGERLEQIKRRAEESAEAKIGHWATWRAQQASKLEAQKATAEAQFKERVTSVPNTVSGTFEKVRSKGEDVINDAMDAADWWKAYGERVAEEAKQFGAEKLSESQDFAYDAMYAWKQKAGQIRNSATDKLGDLKEAGADRLNDLKDAGAEKLDGVQESLGDIKDSATKKFVEIKESVAEMAGSLSETKDYATEKLSEVKDTAAEKLIEAKDSAAEKLSGAKDSAAEKLNDIKETAAEWASSSLESLSDIRDEVNTRASALRDEATQAAYDMAHRGMNNELLRSVADSKEYLADRVSSLVSNLKESLTSDQEARSATLQERWNEIDVSSRAGAWIQQLQYVGEDVRQEILRKLDLMDRSDCVCPKDTCPLRS